MTTRRRLATTGAVWTGGFGVLHVYWALGGRAGVPGSASVTGRPWFLAYDILSAAILLGGAVVAVRLRGGDDPRLVRLVQVGAVVALLRGGIGVAQDVVTLAHGRLPDAGTSYDLWFVVAGVLFWLLARNVRRTAQATGCSAPRALSSTSPVAPARTPRRPSTIT